MLDVAQVVEQYFEAIGLESLASQQIARIMSKLFDYPAALAAARAEVGQQV